MNTKTMNLVNDAMSKIELRRVTHISAVPQTEINNALIAFYSAMLVAVRHTVLDAEVLKIVVERLEARLANAIEILADQFLDVLDD